MDQLNLAISGDVNICDLDHELDPTKYTLFRSACQAPDLHPHSAYRYGCRCRGCRMYRSAYNARMKTGPVECAFDGCTAPRRRTQGARYCEEHATSLQYRITGLQPTRGNHRTCLNCGTVAHVPNSRGYDVCNQCTYRAAALLRTARKHHVQADLLRQWMTNPACQLCGQRLHFGRNSATAGFSIDHDHACCHGGTSCGKCIRGILCNGCNLSLGHMEKMIARSGGLDELLRYVNRATFC